MGLQPWRFQPACRPILCNHSQFLELIVVCRRPQLPLVSHLATPQSEVLGRGHYFVTNWPKSYPWTSSASQYVIVSVTIMILSAFDQNLLWYRVIDIVATFISQLIYSQHSLLVLILTKPLQRADGFRVRFSVGSKQFLESWCRDSECIVNDRVSYMPSSDNTPWLFRIWLPNMIQLSGCEAT